MERGKVREWWLELDDKGICGKARPFPYHIEGVVHVREVIELTDEEKRRVKKLKDHITSNRLLSGEGQQFLLSLLERARVV